MSATTFTSVFLFAAAIIVTTSVAFHHENSNAFVGCIESERKALLNLKDGFKDPTNRLSSWDGDVADCCRWSGVLCDNFTGHVIELNFRTTTLSKLGGKISESLLNLKHLKYLDFSNNNFEGIQIPKFLGSMESLRYLNLSRAGFQGMIPHQLGNLSNLQYFNLDGGYKKYADSLNWLSGLSSLEFLDLSDVNLTMAVDWLDVINKLPSLVELHLSSCMLDKFPPLSTVNFSSLSILDLSDNVFSGPIPVHLQNITLLRQLDLSGNQFNSSIPNWLGGFMHLEILNLGVNDWQGKIPNEIGNLTSLKSLDLSYNVQLDGRIPKSFKNLCKLRSLDLSMVKMSQEINEVIEILSGCVSDTLESLNLNDCHLSGHFTNLVGKFKNLSILGLSKNLIYDPIPEAFGELTSLKFLYLSYNKLNGSLPTGIGALGNLEALHISDNSLEGEVSEIHLANLTNLRRFYASGNQLKLSVNFDWIPPFQNVTDMYLGSWNVGPQFPVWLHSLKHVIYLDLSNSKISSTLPDWFLDFSSEIFFLNLSHNQMYGKISYLPKFDFSMSSIDLSSNHFDGPLPYISSGPNGLDLSNNLFSGSMSNFLCYMNETNSMEILNLGENLLSGELPDCWMNWTMLQVVKLSNNYISGNIPTSIGALRNLEILDLRNNKLSGEIPFSLQNCTELKILDLGENVLGGNIPRWMDEHLNSMVVLNLRRNNFHGNIPIGICRMTYLQILDLADNNLNGTIPRCFNNWSAITKMDSSNNPLWMPNYDSWGFSKSTSVMKNGRMLEYTSILVLVMSLDLSNNKLSGQIPKEITELRGLQVLNLSHNFLSGRIPENIGAMQALESLDFSDNQLYGEIPTIILSLTFLSGLNLSNNNLLGRIPTGTQLQSFNSSSFIGNHLCGPPLTKNCSVDDAPPTIEREDGDETDAIDWFYFYLSIGPGFVVGFWVVMGPLAFNRRWRHFYFNFLDHLWDSIVEWFHVNVVRVVRNYI